MRRLLVTLFVLGTAAGLAAQMSPFTTHVKPQILQPGTTVDLAGVIQGTPRIAGDLCFFGVGLAYDPRISPFVIPFALLGASKFQKVTRQGRTFLVARFRFQVPRRLPPGLRVPLFFQAAAVALTPAGPKVLAATPAKAVLKT